MIPDEFVVDGRDLICVIEAARTVDPSLAAGGCWDGGLATIGVMDANDVVMVTPDSRMPVGLVVSAIRDFNFPDSFRIRVCNVSNSSIDAPLFFTYFVAFAVP